MQITLKQNDLEKKKQARYNDNQLMKKLWIDDIRDAPDDTWTEVRKVQPAISLLYMMDFDVISLDHDIENRPDNETFYPIAHFIGMKHLAFPKWNPEIHIHSSNNQGAKAIAQILQDCGLNPIVKPHHLKYGRYE